MIKNFSFPKWESWSKPTGAAGCLLSPWRFSGLWSNSFQSVIIPLIWKMSLFLDRSSFYLYFTPAVSSFALWWSWRCYSHFMLERMLLGIRRFYYWPLILPLLATRLWQVTFLNLNFLICKVRIFGSFQFRNSVTLFSFL